MSKLRANQLTDKASTGAPTAPNGLVVTGVSTATSFSGSGANLTALNASNIASGTVPTARLGSGTANSTTFLRGDSTFAAAGGGKLLQVVQAYDSSFTRDQITSTTYVATSHSVTITPTAANSNIMLNFSGISNNDGAGQAVNMAIYRSIGGGSFAQFTPSGSNDPGRIGMNKGDQSRNEISFNIQYYDDPSYTLGQAIVYKLYARSVTGHKIEIPSSPQGAPVLCIATEIGA
jgi:hypothetical protein|tara:strand:- start:306 stop:1004 length:699 start_codon:yes stop_codon:yes gene_type:complete